MLDGFVEDLQENPGSDTDGNANNAPPPIDDDHSPTGSTPGGSTYDLLVNHEMETASTRVFSGLHDFAASNSYYETGLQVGDVRGMTASSGWNMRVELRDLMDAHAFIRISEHQAPAYSECNHVRDISVPFSHGFGQTPQWASLASCNIGASGPAMFFLATRAMVTIIERKPNQNPVNPLWVDVTLTSKARSGYHTEMNGGPTYTEVDVSGGSPAWEGLYEGDKSAISAETIQDIVQIVEIQRSHVLLKLSSRAIDDVYKDCEYEFFVAVAIDEKGSGQTNGWMTLETCNVEVSVDTSSGEISTVDATMEINAQISVMIHAE